MHMMILQISYLLFTSVHHSGTVMCPDSCRKGAAPPGGAFSPLNARVEEVLSDVTVKLNINTISHHQHQDTA